MRRIFSILILGTLLSAQVASAITERDLVGAGFPPVQAETVWDLVQQGPVDDLAIGGDAITFAGAGTINSTGSGADITLSSADTIVLGVAGDANRKFSFAAATDNLFYLRYGDGGVTSSQDLIITGSNTNADDDNMVSICGGGELGTSRGALLELKGNEDTEGGSSFWYSGDTATADLEIAAIDDIILKLSEITPSLDVRLITFDATSDTALRMRYGDAGVTAAQDFSITASTADNDDDSVTSIGGGGAIGTSRGGLAQFSGNEDGTPGEVVIASGSAATADIQLIATDDLIITAPTTTTTGTFTSSATGSIGWTAVASVAACNTTCTSACAFGFDTGTSALVSCDNANADTCVCMGAS